MKFPTHRLPLELFPLVIGLLRTPSLAIAQDERLLLRLEDTFNLFPNGSSAVERGVSEAFDSIGVRIRWSRTRATHLATPNTTELVVLLRRSRPDEIGLAPNVMGAVLSRSRPPRMLFIFVPNVARTMEIKLGGMLSVEDERLLARAVSRVIVHEAFHAIAPDLEHARAGLTRARLTKDLLARRRADIASEAADRFRSELGRLNAGLR